jgi:hypothetical protein
MVKNKWRHLEANVRISVNSLKSLIAVQKLTVHFIRGDNRQFLHSNGKWSRDLKSICLINTLFKRKVVYLGREKKVEAGRKIGLLFPPSSLALGRSIFVLPADAHCHIF